MNDKIYRLLEYDKIRTMLSERAASEIGEKVCLETVPSVSYEEIIRLQDETSEGEALLFRNGRSPVDPFDNIYPHIKRAELDSVLSLKELLEIARFFRAVRYTLSQILHDDTLPILSSFRSMLSEDKKLENDISLSVISEEEVSDNASTELFHLRRKKQSANNRIKDMLQNFIRSPLYSKYLQDNLVTIRNDRYVLPVKSEYRSQMPGLVHDQSSSGATIFIEPLSVVEVNNELKQLTVQESQEIERILFDFTQRIKSISEILKTDMEIMTKLDVIFARAKLSRDFRCIRPNINTSGLINIKQARHPLIEKHKVIPIDILLGGEFCLLLITGPNTGGKTVALKTTGLFALMAQSGMHVPAVSADISIFSNIYADIGDAQSIEQSLSTFSSHMTNIAQILKSIEGNALVLFDELGAGTDPDEGAALAMAILDFLRERQIRTIATTHYSELKAYASVAYGAENASVEFNVETLSPTYKLLIGVPGGSNAFAISHRLGLDKHIIEQAKGYLSHEMIKIEDILADAEKHRLKSIADKEQAEQEKKEINKLLFEAQNKLKQIENDKKMIIEQAREKANDILTEAAEKAKEAIDEIKQLVKNTNNDNLQKAKKITSELESEKTSTIFENRKSDTNEVNSGQNVHVISLNADGIALTDKDEKNEVLVSLGNIQLRVDISDVEIIQKEKKIIKPKSGINLVRHDIDMKIDVRGQALDEALQNIDQYLDNVFLSSLNEVVIIHGKGTGVLRDGIRKHLRNHQHVKNFRPGKYGEGEQGVTVVNLK